MPTAIENLIHIQIELKQDVSKQGVKQDNMVICNKIYRYLWKLVPVDDFNLNTFSSNFPGILWKNPGNSNT